MPRNTYPRPELLQAIASMKHDLTESECLKRAERMARQSTPEGRSAIVDAIRKRRKSERSHQNEGNFDDSRDSMAHESP